MSDADALAAQFKAAVEQHSQGRLPEAVALYDAVIRLNPGIPGAHCNRAAALLALQQFHEALLSCDRAIALKPDYADAYINKGSALQALMRLEDALQSYDTGIALKPDLAQAFINRGAILKALNRHTEALASYDRAIALNPGFAQAHYNRGILLKEMERPEEAVRSYDAALKIMPNLVQAYSNRGIALQDLRRLDEAQASYDRAIAMAPEYPEPYWNKSLCTLLTGRFDEGWRLYEWRKRRAAPDVYPYYAQPLWSGQENLQGKTLFVYGEQGLGDTIQFCRYARLAQEQGARVVLSVQDGLVRLLQGLGAVEILGSQATPQNFDFYSPLLSLPLAFKTDQNSIPAKVPYLQAEPARVEAWKAKIGEHGFKIGICWQGDKQSAADLGRSIPLRHFVPLSKIPGVRLISLQKYAGVEQLRALPAGMTVETLGDDFDAGRDAFVDTAAVMENLDLVITSDTAIPHLAGALGRPVWMALKYVPEWRWLLDRADSPWYPTMTLFRQPSAGDWTAVFAQIAAKLAAQVKA